MKSLYIRKWLNPPNSRNGGWIIASCKQDRDDGYRDADLRIGDCNRTISISLDIFTPQDRKAAIRKLGILEDTIGKLRDAIFDIDYKLGDGEK